MICTHPEDMVFERFGGSRWCIECERTVERSAHGITHDQAPYDCGQGDCSQEDAWRVVREQLVHKGFLPAAMSDGTNDAPPAEIPTRRAAWDALPRPHQNDVRQEVGDLLIEYRNKPGMVVEGQIERVLNAVLDA